MSTVRVAAIQHDIVWEDKPANFARLAPMIAAASAAGARIVVLAEMFACGFSMNTAITAEPEGGPCAQFLTQMAAKHDVWICGSAPEVLADGSGDGRPHNVHLLVGPDGTMHRYAKVHPFTFAGEDQHFAPGPGLLTVEIEGLRVSPFVCYDLRFADEFWQLARQTDVFVVPANWPEVRRVHWQALLHARAIENQAYVIGCNRVGEGNGLVYSGDSRIIDPLGELLATGARGETMLFADIDPAHVADVRNRFRFMQDRRTA